MEGDQETYRQVLIGGVASLDLNKYLYSSERGLRSSSATSVSWGIYGVRGPTVRAFLGKSRRPVLFDRWVAAAMHSALANKHMMRVIADAGRLAPGIPVAGSSGRQVISREFAVSAWSTGRTMGDY